MADGEDELLHLGNMKFKPEAGRPREFHGRHSGKTLAALDVNITVYDEHRAELETLLDCEKVFVRDPYKNRSYDAAIRMKSSSYRDGNPYRFYELEVSELDEPPSFDAIEIDGQKFPVKKYRESVMLDDVIGRHVLLELPKREWETLRGLIRPG